MLGTFRGKSLVAQLLIVFIICALVFLVFYRWKIQPINQQIRHVSQQLQTFQAETSQQAENRVFQQLENPLACNQALSVLSKLIAMSQLKLQQIKLEKTGDLSGIYYCSFVANIHGAYATIFNLLSSLKTLLYFAFIEKFILKPTQHQLALQLGLVLLSKKEAP